MPAPITQRFHAAIASVFADERPESNEGDLSPMEQVLAVVLDRMAGKIADLLAKRAASFDRRAFMEMARCTSEDNHDNGC